MRRGTWTGWLTAAVLAVTAGGAASAGATGSKLDAGSNSPSRRGALAVGLTEDQRLVVFRVETPSLWRDVGPITGLSGDTRLVGMDYRPANGVLYGLGNGGGIYTIDAASGFATLRSSLNTALVGTSFDVDFNPVVDRMRVVSDSGQNLRVNVENGMASVDPALNAGAPPVTALGVSGAAYTNNDADANTGTTLFDVDAVVDQVDIQSPANAGSLVPTGKLLIDASADVGFDIYSRLDDSGSVRKLSAYLVTSVAGAKGPENNVYRINLLTGVATKTGKLRTPSPVTDLAIPTDWVNPVTP